MKHQISWDADNSCARLVLVGEFLPEEVAPILDGILTMLEGQGSRHLLVDHTQSPKPVSRKTRTLLEKDAVRVALDKLAFFGVSPLNRMVARVVVGVIGQSNTTNFFKTEADALAWFRAEG